MVLLEHCYQLMDKEGYEINNLDSIIMCEAPKDGSTYSKNEREMSQVKLHCDISQINIKATRGEKLGFVGRTRRNGSSSGCIIKEKKV